MFSLSEMCAKINFFSVSPMSISLTAGMGCPHHLPGHRRHQCTIDIQGPLHQSVRSHSVFEFLFNMAQRRASRPRPINISVDAWLARWRSLAALRSTPYSWDGPCMLLQIGVWGRTDEGRSCTLSHSFSCFRWLRTDSHAIEESERLCSH